MPNTLSADLVPENWGVYGRQSDKRWYALLFTPIAYSECLLRFVTQLRAIPEKIPGVGGRRQSICFSMGGWCGKFSKYMGHWCPTKSKSNYMGGWYFAAWKGKKEYYLPKKGEVLSNLAKRKRRAKQTAETAIFVYMQSSKLGCFRRILVKNATKINSPTVASVAVIISLGLTCIFRRIYSRKNAIG